MSAQGKIFNKAFNSDEIEDIPFNPEWCNGTGYFDWSVEGSEAPGLTIGQMVKSKDENGRRMILIGTRFGNVVVFDRFVKQEDDGVWVFNAPRSKTIKTLIDSSAVGERDMITLLGSWGDFTQNIGFEIEKIAKELYPSTKE